MSVGHFSSGLCSCFEDCGICCYGYWCTPCLYGQNTERGLGDSCCCNCMLYACFPCCACCFAGGTRDRLRHKYGLHAEPCSDCCVHCWCSPCAVCQEAREIHYRHMHGGGHPGHQVLNPVGAPGQPVYVQTTNAHGQPVLVPAMAR